jgi:hypothetical protein
LLDPRPECHAQEVKVHPLLATLLLLVCSVPLAAQDKGYWRSQSSSANSITGDIAISDNRLTINLLTFPIVQARTLTPAEVSAAFDADVNTGGTGVLYRVTVPAERRFLHKNTLCGTDETHWMATHASGRTLQVAFFSGSDAPVFTFEAISNSTNLCGTFTYAR